MLLKEHQYVHKIIGQIQIIAIVQMIQMIEKITLQIVKIILWIIKE